jgi:hypothetical protein
MAAEAVCHDILDTAESLGHQPDLGVRPRFSAPRFVGIRFLPCQEYPNHLLFLPRAVSGGRNSPNPPRREKPSTSVRVTS